MESISGCSSYCNVVMFTPIQAPLTPCPYVNKSLTVCQLNVQSLYLRSETLYCRRKIDEIESNHIICVSETWLDNQIDTTQVDIKDYTFRRKDCTNNREGGLAMYISDSIPHRHATELELPNIDLCGSNSI